MIKGKTNNLFYRFPYEFQLGIQFYLTTLGQHRHTINIDVPRFLNDRWHLWAEVAYFAVLDNNYFGQGADAVYDRSLPNQAASNPQYSRQVYL